MERELKLKIEQLQKIFFSAKDSFKVTLNQLINTIKIDVYHLEENCSSHANSFFEAAMSASSCGLLQNKSELLVKEIKAELANDIRNNPEKYHITKLTENQIMEMVDTNELAQIARDLRAECTKLRTDADSLVQAFEHRRSMLNNEVQLYMSKLSEPRHETQRQQVVNVIAGRKRVKECGGEV